MRKLAGSSIATPLVREKEGACLGAIAGSVGELVSLGHDGLMEEKTRKGK